MILREEQGLMDLDDLALLVALSERGTLAEAARKLKVNHASAWRRLGALEKRLGARLFDRGRTSYVPSAAGEEAIAVALRVLTELSGLERRLAGQDIRPSGIVRLTTTETLLELVAPVVAELRSSHPDLLVETITSNVFFSLTRRDADIALRPASSAPEGLVGRKLAQVATALYASPAYVERHRSEVPAKLDWIAPDESLSHLGSAQWIAGNIPPHRIIHRASSLLGLAAMARTGIGVAPLPCFMADNDDALARMAGPLPEMSTDLWLLTHPDLRQTARVRVVLDLLARRVSQQRRVLTGEAA